MRRLALVVLAVLAACRSTSDPRLALGERTRVAFAGVRSFPEQELLAAIEADRLGPAPESVTRAQVDDAAYAIEEHYRANGFAQVAVDYALEEDADGARALFTVDEGPRLALVSVAFRGNEGVDGETLSLFFLPEGAPQPFVRGRVRSASSGVEEYYYQKGWLRVRVASVDEEVDAASGTVTLTCTVEEGPRSHLRSVRLRLAHEEPGLEEARRALERAAQARLDRPYTPPVAFALRAALLEALGEDARPDAVVEVETTIDPASGDVRLSYRVDPGPRVSIAAVRVEGADPGHDELVRSRLALQEGDAYDATAVRESFANLYRSGLFRSVAIDLAEGDTSARDLLVRVEELPSIEFFVEPGYGSYEGARLSFGIDERNAFGSGNGIRAQSTFGFLAQTASVAWNDPWIASGRYESRVAVSADHREEPSFTKTEYGTELSLARLWNERLRSTLSYSFRRSELDDVDTSVENELPRDAVDDANIASVTLSTTHDDRGQLFTPHHGGRRRASVEWASHAFGSEVDYVGGTLEASQFVSLGDDTVLALRALTALRQPVADTLELPLQERFFNGGENTVRSFAEDELGVEAGGDQAGGQAYNVWNLELRQRLVGHLEAGLFFDAGNVVPQVEDYLHFDDIRMGVGAGLRYLLPIGPVRLDVGWNPDARPGEDDFVVHLAIGMAF